MPFSSIPFDSEQNCEVDNGTSDCPSDRLNSLRVHWMSDPSAQVVTTGSITIPTHTHDKKPKVCANEYFMIVCEDVSVWIEPICIYRQCRRALQLRWITSTITEPPE